MDRPNWKINQQKYIKEYTKGHYYRMTLQFRKEGNPKDAIILEAIKDCPNKTEVIKNLAYEALLARKGK